MADIDGNFVDTGPQTFTGKLAHAVGGAVDFSDPGAGGAALTFRMRATDTTLGQVVYWFSTTIDATGTDYVGPGPLVNIVLQHTLGT